MSESAAFDSVSQHLKKYIAENALEVPMLPEVAGKVVRLTQDPDSDASDLAKLIQSDQTLAGHVMRVANSAAYSPNSSMVSLQQAITRLGMKVITEIALAASVNTSLFNAPGFESHIAYSIKYSLCAGLWAKEVARACRKNVEAAFLSGLLHDIGRPVAIQAALKICQQTKTELSRAELLKLEDLFQREIGLKVVAQWEMPTSVQHVVEFFDNYSEPHSAQHLTMSVVAGALVASHFMCEAEGKEDCMTMEELQSQAVLADLNLYEDEVQTLIDKGDVVMSTLEVMSA